MFTLRNASLALIIVGIAAPIRAEAPGVETATVRVRGAASASPVAMRHLRERIAQAALEVCGAPAGSLVEMKDSVARSQCWRDSYANGIAQIAANNPKPIVLSQRSHMANEP